MKILAAWLGNADIKASASDSEEIGSGPIAEAIKELSFEKLVLLTNQPPDDVNRYVKWIGKKFPIEIDAKNIKLADPTEYRAIYLSVSEIIDDLIHNNEDKIQFTFHITPGTPAMQTIWVLLANTRYEATLIQTAREQDGVKIPDIPFEIAGEFIPKVLKPADLKLKSNSEEIPKEGAHFGDIIYRSDEMATIIRRAKKAAARNVPVLIQGDSGTGKELLARAIYSESARSDKIFIPVNCGAIPENLVESELFGHVKHAFTGADKDRKGLFEQADGGTLFLDEIGELPLSAQVKLLRVLQEEAVRPVGGYKENKVDVRIIAATNRNLSKEVSEGRFREDLFYRLAIAIIDIPPLISRQGDLGLLLDYLLNDVIEELSDDPHASHKIISASARNVVLKHKWPGNVRELRNALKRVVLWSDNDEIKADEMRSAILERHIPSDENEQILNKDLSQPIDIDGVIASVAKHYLKKAMKETAGNKAKAARLLGLNNATTLSNRLKKYGIE